MGGAFRGRFCGDRGFPSKEGPHWKRKGQLRFPEGTLTAPRADVVIVAISATPLQPTTAGLRKERTMTVLTPARETELDAFDLDLRVVPAEEGTGAMASGFTQPTCPTGFGVCDV